MGGGPLELNENPLTEKSGPAGRNRLSRLVVFVEMSGFFAILTGLGYLLTGAVGFMDASVHPYWLVVLFMAAHYGLAWGLSGAAAASMLHVLAAPAGADFARLPLTTIETNGILIAGWILAAAVVGAYRDRSEHRIAAAREARDMARAERDRLADYAETLAQENAELRDCLARGGRNGPAMPSDASRSASAAPAEGG